jgi:hypothetical protein
MYEDQFILARMSFEEIIYWLNMYPIETSEQQAKSIIFK